ncbi:redox-regulated ATPase YchF [Candidatus Micrarchaeota archaeon]|nr:redox-regulated ATPase YchF [Candidatus Micrarchaeota archaeon]
MKIGLVGKPSSGKSTFFSAATLLDVPISPRPFTTIRPNVGTAFARVDCACRNAGVSCEPKQGKCVEGKRFVPFTLIDVAGLIPGSHEGRGLGNQFLNDLMEAEGFLHVVDASGLTDEFGNPTSKHDPSKDVSFLEEELDSWIRGILEKNWKNVDRKTKQGFPPWEAVSEAVAGLGLKPPSLKAAVDRAGSDLGRLAKEIRLLKPSLVVANKCDLPQARGNLPLLLGGVPASADSELALRKADKAGLIRYVPGDASFEEKNASGQQKAALEHIRKNVLESFNGTGVQQAIDRLVLEKLGYIPVFPVVDEKRLADGEGRILPDCFLLKKGSTPLELAFKIHEDIGKGFIASLDARTGRKTAKDLPLDAGAVVKIIAKK